MKKILFIITLLFHAIASASQFEEGVHYEVLQTPINNNIEVREFFSFYCPHCFTQESIMKEIAMSLPANVPFTKNHVAGMPGRDADIESYLTKAMLVAQKLNQKEEVVGAIFNYIHTNKATFGEVKDIQNLLAVNGISEQQFEKGIKNFSIIATEKKMQKMTASMRRQGISAVPTLVVNGKYRPLTQSISSMEQYKALIRFLVDKKA